MGPYYLVLQSFLEAIWCQKREHNHLSKWKRAILIKINGITLSKSNIITHMLIEIRIRLLLSYIHFKDMVCTCVNSLLLLCMHFEDTMCTCVNSVVIVVQEGRRQCVRVWMRYKDTLCTCVNSLGIVVYAFRNYFLHRWELFLPGQSLM